MLRLGPGQVAPGSTPVKADALDLPFPDAPFDGAMVGWGIRNLMDLDAGLREAARVLEPGARLVILEMTLPPQPRSGGSIRSTSAACCRWIGRLISKHTTAYTWLPESTQSFPGPEELARRMERAGFTDVRYELFLGGVDAHARGDAGKPCPSTDLRDFITAIERDRRAGPRSPTRCGPASRSPRSPTA